MRPSVSVIVPVASAARVEEVARRLRELVLEPGDELVIVDNSASATPRQAGTARVIAATAERSPYYARNIGAEHAGGEWLLFTDDDCALPPDLLERMFGDGPDPGCGVIAGAVRPRPPGGGLIAAYSAERGAQGELWHLDAGPAPAGMGGNLAVAKQAFDAVGGFFEGVRSDADYEICWRIQEAGWRFRHRPGAEVRHAYPESARELWRRTVRHAAGRAWINRRYPGAMPPPRLVAPIVRTLGGALVALVRVRPRLAAFRALDAATAVVTWGAYKLGSNRAGDRSAGRAGGTGVIAAEFAAQGAGEPAGAAVVEALSRPRRQDRALSRRIATRYACDDPAGLRVWAAMAMLARHPVRSATSSGHRRGGGLRLIEIAAPARRLERDRVSALTPLDTDSLARAQAIALLLGVRVQDRIDGAPPDQETVTAGG